MFFFPLIFYCPTLPVICLKEKISNVRICWVTFPASLPHFYWCFTVKSHIYLSVLVSEKTFIYIYPLSASTQLAFCCSLQTLLLEVILFMLIKERQWNSSLPPSPLPPLSLPLSLSISPHPILFREKKLHRKLERPKCDIFQI